jgi:acyl-CoA thioesterase-2
MTTPLEHLLAVVTLTDVGDDTFEGIGSSNDGVDATFGGHFLGQATAAAIATVEPDRRLHSIHGYFLRGGRPGEPFRIMVERLRDGRSFSTRRVRISQDEGKTQFELLASFAVDEDGPVIDPPPPLDFDDLPEPESLPTYGEIMRSLETPLLPAEWALRDYGLDIRTVDAPWAPGGPSSEKGIRFWVRATEPLAIDHKIQTALLAYQSDESLADNVAVPFGATWGSPDVVFVSLDHAMWFHRPFDLNQWHFIDQRPVTAAGGRGLATGSVWTKEAKMVASFTQEALLRLGDQYS